MADLPEDFLDLVLEEKAWDVILVVGDREFPILKEKLANKSGVFETMFFGKFKEANEGRIEIKNTSPEAFKGLLEILFDKRHEPSRELIEMVDPGCREINNDGSECTYSSVDMLRPWKFIQEILQMEDFYMVEPVVTEYLCTKMLFSKCFSSNKNSHCMNCLNWKLLSQSFDIKTYDLLQKKFFSLELMDKWYELAKQFPEYISTEIYDVIKLGPLDRNIRRVFNTEGIIWKNRFTGSMLDDPRSFLRLDEKMEDSALVKKVSEIYKFYHDLSNLYRDHWQDEAVFQELVNSSFKNEHFCENFYCLTCLNLKMLARSLNIVYRPVEVRYSPKLFDRMLSFSETLDPYFTHPFRLILRSMPKSF